MHVANDGTVSLTYDELLPIPMQHLISGLDDDQQVGDTVCGGSTTLTGYTEWITPTQPALTLGWDWRFDYSEGTPRLCRIGEPRSNIALMDAAQEDTPWRRSLELLAGFVDGMDWRNATLAALAGHWLPQAAPGH